MAKQSNIQKQAQSQQKQETVSEDSVVEVLEKPDAVEVALSEVEQPAPVKVSEVHKELSAYGKQVMAQLEEYATAMDPRMVFNEQTGIQQQSNLFHLLGNLMLSSSNEDFAVVYAAVLKRFADGQTLPNGRPGVFSGMYLFRADNRLNLSQDQRRFFDAVRNLMVATCDVKSRTVGLNQVNLQATTAALFDTDSRNRLVAFYG
ncbi:MAG: hypothetical protein E6Q68_07525 [Polynucleobacter sp.]|nr:MAG: hypothetical protein E6Q68_07525 [Polynucleobacter sp.]